MLATRIYPNTVPGDVYTQLTTCSKMLGCEHVTRTCPAPAPCFDAAPCDTASGCKTVARVCPMPNDRCKTALPCDTITNSCPLADVVCTVYGGTSKPGQCGLSSGCNSATGCGMTYTRCAVDDACTLTATCHKGQCVKTFKPDCSPCAQASDCPSKTCQQASCAAGVCSWSALQGLVCNCTADACSQVTREPSYTCMSSPFDVSIVLDESGSIISPVDGGLAQNWEDMLAFIKAFASRYAAGSDATQSRLALSGFSSLHDNNQQPWSNVYVALNSAASLATPLFNAAVDAYTSLRGYWTAIGCGLLTGANELRSSVVAGRTQQVLVIVTDGNSNTGDSTYPIATIVNNARKDKQLVRRRRPSARLSRRAR